MIQMSKSVRRPVAMMLLMLMPTLCLGGWFSRARNYALGTVFGCSSKITTSGVHTLSNSWNENMVEAPNPEGLTNLGNQKWKRTKGGLLDKLMGCIPGFNNIQFRCRLDGNTHVIRKLVWQNVSEWAITVDTPRKHYAAAENADLLFRGNYNPLKHVKNIVTRKSFRNLATKTTIQYILKKKDYYKNVSGKTPVPGKKDQVFACYSVKQHDAKNYDKPKGFIHIAECKWKTGSMSHFGPVQEAWAEWRQHTHTSYQDSRQKHRRRLPFMERLLVKEH